MDEILEAVNAEIEKLTSSLATLKQVQRVLMGGELTPDPKPKPKPKPRQQVVVHRPGFKRTVSPEGRARMALAQQQRRERDRLETYGQDGSYQAQ